MKNFKINKTDILLLIGFVLSCIVIMCLSMSLNEQIANSRTYSALDQDKEFACIINQYDKC